MEVHLNYEVTNTEVKVIDINIAASYILVGSQ